MPGRAGRRPGVSGGWAGHDASHMSFRSTLKDGTVKLIPGRLDSVPQNEKYIVNKRQGVVRGGTTVESRCKMAVIWGPVFDINGCT